MHVEVTIKVAHADGTYGPGEDIVKVQVLETVTLPSEPKHGEPGYKEPRLRLPWPAARRLLPGAVEHALEKAEAKLAEAARADQRRVAEALRAALGDEATPVGDVPF